MLISDIEFIREQAYKPLNTIESPGRIAFVAGVSAACERVIIEVKRIGQDGFLTSDDLMQLNQYCADSANFSPIDDFDRGMREGFSQIKNLVVADISNT